MQKCIRSKISDAIPLKRYHLPVSSGALSSRAEGPRRQQVSHQSEKHPLDARDIIKSPNNMLHQSEPGCLQATEERPHDTDLTTAPHDNQSIGFRHVLKMMDNIISHNEHRKGFTFFLFLWLVGWFQEQ
ncbi:hypothetical protein CEXT_272181 [Caerostris extrusa]|uniref:Uncharacterized protein n=1 Tax=Caerostris extrusa TaxID=172846 RepID=A0AAV4VUC9_CAEEX|nr:hypothetical protein CEXT_272181 [Caerostris extrusa]